MTEVTRTINNVNDLSTAQSDITSLQESVNNNTTNISTLELESYTVLNGTNFGIGPGVMVNLTMGTKNTAIGNGAAGGAYGLTDGNNNVMVGFNAGGGCKQGSNNNTFLGTITQFMGGTYMNSSIGLGEGVIVSGYNQFMVALNITSFNISGLAASTGSGEGTILEFDSAGNILPSVGTLNSVSKIDSAVSTLQSYVVSNGSNFGIGPGVLGNLTTGTQNTVVGNWEDVLPYTITTGSNNTFIGYNTGKSCEQGSNNTIISNLHLAKLSTADQLN